MDDEIGQRRVDNAGGIELLARDGRADDGEDARTNDSPDAKCGQRPRPESFFQRVLWFLRVADQLVYRFTGNQLAGQGRSPVSSEYGAIESGPVQAGLVRSGDCLPRGGATWAPDPEG
jgi:hypothetical protein